MRVTPQPLIRWVGGRWFRSVQGGHWRHAGVSGRKTEPASHLLFSQYVSDEIGKRAPWRSPGGQMGKQPKDQSLEASSPVAVAELRRLPVPVRTSSQR